MASQPAACHARLRKRALAHGTPKMWSKIDAPLTRLLLEAHGSRGRVDEAEAVGPLAGERARPSAGPELCVAAASAAWAVSSPPPSARPAPGCTTAAGNLREGCRKSPASTQSASGLLLESVRVGGRRRCSEDAALEGPGLCSSENVAKDLHEDVVLAVGQPAACTIEPLAEPPPALQFSSLGRDHL
eukprot:CAMPEP_0203901316 /NCGR_PEP_ID=MMETSP0359-20131031/43496_1 /ASSEMBLY_ACC=CAM_ASM_000338 /TAXON_ID=268821 /ORGANISM="Scrippsiella Hangoei, Strain SHTV-5" /LENGTH=186 /DNA_ID=CAMNT_0050824953 /DNA_START=476 /DNA_END=1038 /DNA_ORIENTATION=+